MSTDLYGNLEALGGNENIFSHIAPGRRQHVVHIRLGHADSLPSMSGVRSFRHPEKQLYERDRIFRTATLFWDKRKRREKMPESMLLFIKLSSAVV